MDSLGKRYDYIDDLKFKFKQNDISFLDYTHPDRIGSTDCEFGDGFHGGEITYARILKDMSEKSNVIHELVDINGITKLINENSGMTISTMNFASGGYEVDYLELGCAKHKKH